MSNWRQHVESERVYTLEDQVRDIEASIDLKKRAVNFWTEQSQKPWNSAPGTQKSYVRKLADLNREIIALERKRDMLTGETPTEEVAVVDNEVETVEDTQSPMETLVVADAENAVLDALENSNMEANFASALEQGGAEVAQEVVEELSGVEATGVPNVGRKESPSYKFEYVRIFVDVLFNGLDDNYAIERGFENIQDYKNFVISHIEANPIVTIELAGRIARNKNLSSTIRMIAKAAIL